MEKTSISSDGRSPTLETQIPKFATEDDIPAIFELVKDFVAYSPYGDIDADEAALLDKLYECLDHGCLITNGTGFIAGLLSPLFIKPSVSVVHELAWWAPKGGGAELRNMLEEWGRSKGAHMARMTSLNNETGARVTSNLVSNGYVPVEIAYIKVLT